MIKSCGTNRDNNFTYNRSDLNQKIHIFIILVKIILTRNELAEPIAEVCAMHTAYDCIDGKSITGSVNVIIAGFEPYSSLRKTTTFTNRSIKQSLQYHLLCYKIADFHFTLQNKKFSN